MDLRRHPELLDRLAAAHALGTLRGGARRRFEAMARQSPAVRAAALAWQERFAAMTELQPAQVPSENVWKRIENLLPAATPPVAHRETPMLDLLRRRLGWWRGAAFGGAVAAAVVAVVGWNLNTAVRERDDQLAQVRQRGEQLARENTQLAAQLQSRPDIQYVAVLADEKSSAQVLVTFDPRQNRLTLKHVGGFHVASDKSLELWALPQGAAPKSLGVLPADPVARLTALETQVRESPALAITLEPRGGAPGGAPTGPILFKGALLQTPTT